MSNLVLLWGFATPASNRLTTLSSRLVLPAVLLAENSAISVELHPSSDAAPIPITSEVMVSIIALSL
ncbi:hypothetical protein GOD70_27585 [Sinorhizobium medicae]|nr:hypothetical protein [Sinorhizobium medicae]